MNKILLLILAIVMSGSLRAQDDLQSTLSALSADAAKAYVGPIVSGFGANLNSGWIHRAVPNKFFGIDFEFGVVAMGTLFGDDAKTFSSTGIFRFSKPQAEQLTSGISNTFGERDSVIKFIINEQFTVGITGPTIVGSKNDNVVVSFGGKTYTVATPTGNQSVTVQPDTIQLSGVSGFLEDLSILPLAAPQLTIGTFYGTALSFRYLPDVEIDKDLGKFKYFGFGVQHNPSMWIPVPLPVDISVGFFTQTMEVGKIFKSEASTLGIYLSKQFGPGMFNITPYAGLMLESSNITVTYDFTLEDTPAPGVKTILPIEFEVEGQNSSRFLVGASIKLALINLNVDYNIAKYNSISAGLAFGF